MKNKNIQKLNNIIRNTKPSAGYILSAMAFFALLFIPMSTVCVGIAIGFGAAVFYSGYIETEADKRLKIFALLSSIGILGSNFKHKASYYDLFTDVVPIRILYLCLSIGAIYFVYKLLLFFYSKFRETIKDIRIEKEEARLYGIIIAITSVFTFIVFANTDAFYGVRMYDVVYTSDSSVIVQYNAYSSLLSFENDLRQPLFAVFAAPFTGIFQLAGLLMPEPIEAAIVNISQIALLVAANYILADALELKKTGRISFMLFSSCTYAFMLFSLMMEQYIIVYFWTILFIHTYVRKKDSDLVLFGAAGTLITNLIFFPLNTYNSDIKKWVKDCAVKCLAFLGLMLAAGRMDLLGGAKSNVDIFKQFLSLPDIEALKQYTCFVKNIFIAPEAGQKVIETAGGTGTHMSWQLAPATFSIVGIIIIALAIVSLVINRKDTVSRLCGAWIAFSVLIMVIFGWGTAENGLILYSLYFGWAYMVLLFKLLETIEEKTGSDKIIPVISAILNILLLIVNIRVIRNLIAFAVKYYPTSPGPLGVLAFLATAIFISLGTFIYQRKTGKILKYSNLLYFVFCSETTIFLMQYMLTMNFTARTDSVYIILEHLINLTVILLFATLIPSFKWGTNIGCVVMLIFSTIDKYIVTFRGTEIDPDDILGLKTALNVSSGYSLAPTQFMLFVWGIFIVLMCIFNLIRINEPAKKTLILITAIVFVLTTGLFAATTKNKASLAYDNAGTYYNGLSLNFCLKLFEGKVEVPDGYDPAELEVATSNYKIEATKERPNIIVICNESFADLSVIGDLDTNKEIMPFVNSLEENTVKGHVYVSVFGGQTPKSEYEFLTGNTLGLLPKGTNPFVQTVSEDTHSMVSELKGRDYYCIGMHPCTASGWNRDEAYPALGFNESLFLEDFPQDDLVRGLVSDRSAYKTLIEKYEEAKKPVFIHCMTMQNHGGWDKGGYKSTVSLNNMTNKEAEQYLSLINESDKAIQELIEYLAEKDEKTIVVFFGNHYPGLPSNFYNNLHGSAIKSNDLDEYEKLYKVPFFIWANYEIENQSDVETSLNYLSNYVYKTAGFTPQYNAVLEDIEETVPIINSVGYWSKSEGRFIPIKEAKGSEKKQIEFYRCLIYNETYDKSFKLSVFRASD